MNPRLRDWQERLDALVNARTTWPFVWGINDCCIFAADAVQAITGDDVMGDLRQRYGSALDAYQLIRDMGGLQAAITGLIGEPCDAKFAAVGDLVLVHNASRELLCVCNGTSGLAPGQDGLVSVDLTAPIAAWRVG